MKKYWIIFIVLFVFVSISGDLVLECNAKTTATNGLNVTDNYNKDSFNLVHSHQAADIYIDSCDATVVRIAAEAFQKDIEQVTGVQPVIKNDIEKLSTQAVIIGTIGKAQIFNRLPESCRLNIDSIRGKWETFFVTVINRPFTNVERALVITGSDRRGTAFGVFHVSRMIGVSPWVWWADVAPAHRDGLYITGDSIIEGPPSVKYRGIFLNDEDWGLQPWAAKNMDTDIRDIGPKTYARIFELLLRLKANYIWPAMHPCTKAFYYYPENPKVADQYAIVVGSSHCEPMLRNNVFEWSKNFENEYGQRPGEWRYDTNRGQIYQYWEDRVKQSCAFESVYTVGMRGIHDSGIPGPKSQNEKIELLQKVINDQRRLLAKYFNKPADEIPQIFCPYKEVLQIYQHGLKLPDDVTIVWADDNHGYIRQLSNPQEQQRPGASGVYYHLSYWGAPHDYLWLSSTSPALVSYEMIKAFRYGANRLWVFNVGDIKPAEMEMQFAMDLAWNVESWSPERAHEYPEVWAEETFGSEFAETIAKIKSEYYRLAQAGKPEHLDTLEFDENEAYKRLNDYQTIAAEAETISKKIPQRLQDAFFQLILYPIKCACLMNGKILYARKSLQLAQKGDDKALEYAQKAKEAFESIQTLTHKYNEEISGGKWSGMMSWHPRDLAVFRMPKVATAAMVERVKKAGAASTVVEKEQSSKIVIPATDYTDKREISDERVQTIRGLGGKSITLMPFIAQSVSEANIQEASFVEYKLNLTSGRKEINVKCLPTHSIHEGRSLRYAISINGDNPQVVDVHTSSRSRDWRENVLRGYSMGRTTHQIDVSGQKVIRVYLLDPGLVINTIEVL